MTTFIATIVLLGLLCGVLPPSRRVTAIQEFELPIYYLLLTLLLSVIAAKFSGTVLMFPVCVFSGAAGCAIGVTLRRALRRLYM